MRDRGDAIRSCGILQLLVLCLALADVLVYADDTEEEEARLQKTTDAWKAGDPIPPALLIYRPSHSEGSCFPDPRGTEMRIDSVTNLGLLREIVFQPQTDIRVFSIALNHLLVSEGPNRF